MSALECIYAASSMSQCIVCRLDIKTKQSSAIRYPIKCFRPKNCTFLSKFADLIGMFIS